MRRNLAGVVVAVALTVAACSTGATTPSAGGGTHASPRSAAHTSPHSSARSTAGVRSSAAASAPASRTSQPAASTFQPATPASTPKQVLASMTLRQVVGQLLMVDCPSTEVAAQTVTDITDYHVGSVILDGDSTLSIAQTAAITSALQTKAGSGPKLFVSTDQEGGLVRRLRGSGFSNIPSALSQGTTSPASLQTHWTTWAGQLRRAGVNLDLAPVMDTVPANFGSNPPIGNLDREYGHTPSVVSTHGLAVLRGMAAAHIDATIKHFPGLGRVRGNTDTSSGVTDHVTTATSSYLDPYAAAVKAGVPFVMMSTAIYARIDPGVPGAFSKPIVTGILRNRMGFTGVVISDDLGAAKQVSGYSVGGRAVRFVDAGGDMVLTVNAGLAKAMADALVTKAKAEPWFDRLVRAAALRVLTAKQARGLL